MTGMTKYGIFVGGELVAKYDTMTEAVNRQMSMTTMTEARMVNADEPVTTDLDTIQYAINHGMPFTEVQRSAQGAIA